ncbi:transcriptional regulator family: bZIP [Purpureocillium lilacinum]|uniref:Basic leucine zipper transcriptional factor ATF-like n=1 Tax=Purpureocillium lilacinum TaxID=33203 RepID=A0ABR0BHN8_PURLI|nr:transcriptional regulator family: bZIP [Purpureocillium lilacinum]
MRLLGDNILLPATQLGGQLGDDSSYDLGLTAEEQRSLLVSMDMAGRTKRSSRYIDGTMAVLDAEQFSVCGRRVIDLEISNASCVTASGNSTSRSSLSSTYDGLPESMALDEGPSEATSLKPKSSLAKNRGRPRKTRPGTKATNSGCPTSTKSHGKASGSTDLKALQARERNRIAADKCRSRRRQEEDRLKSKHNDLERQHRKLSGTLSDLMAEIYVLKNMLVEHGSCDCRLIQDYLKESASEWVAKKLVLATSPAGTAPFEV